MSVQSLFQPCACYKQQHTPKLSPIQDAVKKIRAGEDLQQSMASVDPFNRSLLGRVKDHVTSTLRAINFGITRNMRGKISYLLNLRPEFCELDKKETWNQWNEKSKGLILMLHGLRGHPSQFDSHVRNLRKEKDLDLRVPFITNKGDDSKENLLAPLQELIGNYIESQKQKDGKKPIKICLIGISNGGRLSVMLTGWLAEKYPEVELLGLANAPVLHGTKITSTLPFRASGFHESIIKDFEYKGRDRKWVRRAVSNLPDTFKLRTYIAMDDLMVYPYSAAMLPPLKNINNRFYRGQGHISILRGAEKDHLKEISSFLAHTDKEVE